MFEDEQGLHLENVRTGETSKVFLERDLEESTTIVQAQQEAIAGLRMELASLRASVEAQE